MQLHLYNTLSRSVEPFEPISPPAVLMYSCGPTVYDFAHIGNFRSFLFADLLRRTLELLGHDVQHVMNITDVGHMTEDAQADGGGEDKMLVAAERLKEAKKAGTVEEGAVADPSDPYQIAAYYADAFVEDANLLGIKVASDASALPRATDHIPQMLELIDELIERGHAYIASDGVVYYDVKSFPDYGSLSGNTLESLREGMGGRITADNQANKKHPADFMLWKPDSKHLMKWDSKFGEGYPGWHLECSALARKKLGADVIDIHTGGEDLVFPHHECEIAQSRGASGEQHFARFFCHARFLLYDGQKMSKSKGTFFTVRDVLAGKVTGREVDPAVLRYALMRAHYRQNQNFTPESLSQAAAEVGTLRRVAHELEQAGAHADRHAELDHPVVRAFAEALCDDLNISGAIGAVLPWAKGDHSDPSASLAALRAIDSVLGVIEASQPAQDPDDSFDPQAICAKLDEARQNKDFGTADALRAKLKERGYAVRTTAEGTVAEKELA